MNCSSGHLQHFDRGLIPGSTSIVAETVRYWCTAANVSLVEQQLAYADLLEKDKDIGEIYFIWRIDATERTAADTIFRTSIFRMDRLSFIWTVAVEDDAILQWHWRNYSFVVSQNDNETICFRLLLLSLLYIESSRERKGEHLFNTENSLWHILSYFYFRWLQNSILNFIFAMSIPSDASSLSLLFLENGRQILPNGKYPF